VDKDKTKTLEQRWAQFHKAVAHTIHSDAQLATMKACYYEGVKAMVCMIAQEFTDPNSLTPKQHKLILRSLCEAQKNTYETHEFIEELAKEKELKQPRH
jgi:hypothetical protein